MPETVTNVSLDDCTSKEQIQNVIGNAVKQVINHFIIT